MVYEVFDFTGRNRNFSVSPCVESEMSSEAKNSFKAGLSPACPEKLLFFQERGLAPTPSKFLQGGRKNAVLVPISLFPASLVLLWDPFGPQIWGFMECLPVEGGRAGGFVLVHCSWFHLDVVGV